MPYWSNTIRGVITVWRIVLPAAMHTTVMLNWRPVVSNMSSEPNVTPQIREAAFRLLCLNHTFTSYISALGAHREQLTNPEILAFLDDAVCYVDDALHHQPADEERVNQALAGLKQRMQQLEPRADSKEPLVVQQVGLLIALLPEIGRLQRQITQVPQETPVSA